MSEYRSPTELDDGCRQALYHLLLILADSKHLLGLRYAEWLSAPQIEASIAAVAMAQDELGHARLLYSLVEPFYQELSWPRRPEEPSEYCNIEALDHEFNSWAQFVAANALLDSVLFIQLDDLQRSSYRPLRGRLPKILEEERYHFQHGRGWFLRLAGEAPTRDQLSACVKALWPELLRWLGDPADQPLQALHAAGITPATPDELRERWLSYLSPLLDAASLDLPLSRDEIAAGWQDWDESCRRRGRQGPDQATWAQIVVPEAQIYPVG